MLRVVLLFNQKERLLTVGDLLFQTRRYSHGDQYFLDSHRDLRVARTHSLYHPLDARPPCSRDYRSRLRLDHLGQDHRALEDHRFKDRACRARRRASGVRATHLTKQEQMDSAQISATTRFLCRCVFFFDEWPAMNDWVSVLVDENDTSIKVGNIMLVERCYGDGVFYPKSVMPFPTFLKRRKSRPKPGQDYENPLTARLMTYDQMEKFRRKFEQIMGDKLVFEYSPEIVIPKLVIPPAEFYRTSRTG